jgi:hypothetical protein
LPAAIAKPVASSAFRAGTFSFLWQLNRQSLAATYPTGQTLREAAMTHWNDTMVDRPESDGAIYATGWSISVLAVLGTIFAVWIFGI